MDQYLGGYVFDLGPLGFQFFRTPISRKRHLFIWLEVNFGRLRCWVTVDPARDAHNRYVGFYWEPTWKTLHLCPLMISLGA